MSTRESELSVAIKRAEELRSRKRPRTYPQKEDAPVGPQPPRSAHRAHRARAQLSRPVSVDTGGPNLNRTPGPPRRT